MLAATTITLFSTLIGWMPTGFRFHPSDLPVQYCIRANASAQVTSLTAAQQKALIQLGIFAWVSQGAGGSLSGTNFSVVEDTGTCPTVIDGNDGKRAIFFNANWTHGSGVLGVTHNSGGGSCGQVTDDTGTVTQLFCAGDPDIELNGVSTDWVDGFGGTDVTAIAMHEFGHLLGMGHCGGDSGSNGTCTGATGVMFASYSGGPQRVLFTDDAEGGRALYPGTPGGVGYPCTANPNVCTAGNFCLNPPGYCTTVCTVAGGCLAGYLCEANPSMPAQMVCLRDDGLDRELCEICSPGLAGSCNNNGICGFASMPEPNIPRCVTPCPNPSATDGACPTNYTCFPIMGGGSYCFPKSSDCTNLTNWGQTPICGICQGSTDCGGDGICAGGLSPVQNEGRCATQCPNPGAMDGGCPNLYTCAQFQGGGNYCIPRSDNCTDLNNIPMDALEGQQCGMGNCSVGPCLTSGAGTPAICYKDCAGNPGACNSAQTCETFNLSGGGTVSVCEPPGARPLPDAGVPDFGPPIDSGMQPPPDAGVVDPDGGGNIPGPDGGGVDPGCTCDLSFACDQGPRGGDCSCDPECTTNMPCPCDTDFCCTIGCSCDGECGCPCDTTFACDENSNGDRCSCDQECEPGCPGYVAPEPKDDPGSSGGGCGGCNASGGGFGVSGLMLVTASLWLSRTRRIR